MVLAVVAPRVAAMAPALTAPAKMLAVAPDAAEEAAAAAAVEVEVALGVKSQLVAAAVLVEILMMSLTAAEAEAAVMPWATNGCSFYLHSWHHVLHCRCHWHRLCHFCFCFCCCCCCCCCCWLLVHRLAAGLLQRKGEWQNQSVGQEYVAHVAVAGTPKR